jgi:hypothetical protein
MMHAYKGGGETSYQLVDALLTYAAAAHWGCAVDNDGATPTSWAYVPSLSGRQGTHPIQQIASRFLKRVPAIEVTPRRGLAEPGASILATSKYVRLTRST